MLGALAGIFTLIILLHNNSAVSTGSEKGGSLESSDGQRQMEVAMWSWQKDKDGELGSEAVKSAVVKRANGKKDPVSLEQMEKNNSKTLKVSLLCRIVIASLKL